MVDANGGDSSAAAADATLGNNDGVDGGSDAGTGAHSHVGVDSGPHAGADAASDASFSGGPTCATSDDGAPSVVADTGLYSDFSNKTIATAAGVHAFDPGLHLWSDGLAKSRYIYLPPGTQIVTSGGDQTSGGTMDEWVFPVGTRVWKEFTMQGTRIETRFFEKCADGSWIRTTYRWSADGQTTATELTTGELIPNTVPTANGAMYEVPRRDQCYDCHGGRVDNLLGFEAVALSWTGDSWSSPATFDDSQAMDRISTLGLLTQNPTSPIVIPGRNQDERDSFAWLHINCGVCCHNSGTNARARDTGLYMRLGVTSMAMYSATSTWTTAVNVASKFQPSYDDGGIPSGWNRITLGNPDTSVIPYRDGTRDNGTTIVGQQMPPIISHAVDGPDTTIVRGWITNATP
jgi:hypothetical protein